MFSFSKDSCSFQISGCHIEIMIGLPLSGKEVPHGAPQPLVIIKANVRKYCAVVVVWFRYAYLQFFWCLFVLLFLWQQVINLTYRLFYYAYFVESILSLFHICWKTICHTISLMQIKRVCNEEQKAFSYCSFVDVWKITELWSVTCNLIYDVALLSNN
jgi:hypothetical protein